MPNDLMELAERVANGAGADNALDVLVEIALFEPDAVTAAIRANAAGTKVIYTTNAGSEYTAWAWDWTMERGKTAAVLRARSAS